MTKHRDLFKMSQPVNVDPNETGHHPVVPVPGAGVIPPVRPTLSQKLDSIEGFLVEDRVSYRVILRDDLKNYFILSSSDLTVDKYKGAVRRVVTAANTAGPLATYDALTVLVCTPHEGSRNFLKSCYDINPDAYLNYIRSDMFANDTKTLYAEVPDQFNHEAMCATLIFIVGLAMRSGFKTADHIKKRAVRIKDIIMAKYAVALADINPTTFVIPTSHTMAALKMTLYTYCDGDINTTNNLYGAFVLALKNIGFGPVGTFIRLLAIRRVQAPVVATAIMGSIYSNELYTIIDLVTEFARITAAMRRAYKGSTIYSAGVDKVGEQSTLTNDFNIALIALINSTYESYTELIPHGKMTHTEFNIINGYITDKLVIASGITPNPGFHILKAAVQSHELANPDDAQTGNADFVPASDDV